MIKISSNISDTVVRVRDWVSRIAGPGRKKLYHEAAKDVSVLVINHLRKLNGWKHLWADKLHAQTTEFLAKAAENTSYGADEDAGIVTIGAPGFGRAFHDVEIRPKNAAYLTIPASAEAYGKRAGMLASLGWKLWKPKGRKFLMGSTQDVEPKILYWLKASVHQKQDRDLLPSDADMQRAAAGAMMAEIRRIAS